MGLVVTNALREGRPIGLRAEEGVIAALGPEVVARPGDEVLDASGMAILPGLVNGHTHAAMTLFRGHGDDLPLMRWLREEIWPVEARLVGEDVYWGARLACLEMIRTGTVRFWDMYWHADQTARAVEDSGLTAVIGAPLFDAGGEEVRGLRETALRSLDELGRRGPAIDAALAPHAIYTVTADSLRWVAELAAERELPIHIHLSETREEVEECVREHGVRPAFHLDALGLLGPRTLLAHGVWLDAEELDLIATRGATLVTNPVANLKLAVGGIFPYPAARERGVPVGLGADGPGSNNSLDLLADAKFFALAQKHAAASAEAVTAGEALAIASGARAPLLGRSGELAPGEPADFLLIPADAAELIPGDLTANLVYAASGRVVDTTVVAGRVLMRGGTVNGEEEVVARALARAERLGLTSSVLR